MAADQDRAERIRALKGERPDLTWRRIGDLVGVSERSAFEWGKKGGIDYENAKKLAGVFEVDIDYIWRGAGSTTPDLMGGSSEQRWDDRQEEILAELAAVRALLQALAMRFEVDAPPGPPGELGRRLRAVDPTQEDQQPPESPPAEDSQ